MQCSILLFLSFTLEAFSLVYVLFDFFVTYFVQIYCVLLWHNRYICASLLLFFQWQYWELVKLTDIRYANRLLWLWLIVEVETRVVHVARNGCNLGKKEQCIHRITHLPKTRWQMDFFCFCASYEFYASGPWGMIPRGQMTIWYASGNPVKDQVFSAAVVSPFLVKVPVKLTGYYLKSGEIAHCQQR